MNLTRWLVAIALLVGLGCLQVAQRNAIVLKGYALGQRTSELHAQETAVAWLGAEVNGLQSPAHLARVAQQRRLKFVAWRVADGLVPFQRDEPNRLGEQTRSVPARSRGKSSAEIVGTALVHVASTD